MKNKHNLENNKKRLFELSQNLYREEIKLDESFQTETLLKETVDEAYRTSIDERSKQVIQEAIGAETFGLMGKSREFTAMINAHMVELENLKRESQFAIEAAYEESNELKKTRRMLDQFGLGKSMEGAINSLEASSKAEEDFLQKIDIIEKDALSFSERLTEFRNHNDVQKLDALLWKIPENRRNSIDDMFSSCGDRVRPLLEKVSDDICIGTCQQVFNVKKGRMEMETPSYDTRSKLIRMDDRVSERDYIETFAHEFGHHIDYELGHRSLYDDRFSQALEADYEHLNPSKEYGYKAYVDMLDHLVNDDMLYSARVSDILSGMFNNSETIIQVYASNGFGHYGHEDAYWDEHGIEGEIYAELFAMNVLDYKNEIAFVERFFPNTVTRFYQMVEEEGRNG